MGYSRSLPVVLDELADVDRELRRVRAAASNAYQADGERMTPRQYEFKAEYEKLDARRETLQAEADALTEREASLLHGHTNAPGVPEGDFAPLTRTAPRQFNPIAEARQQLESRALRGIERVTSTQSPATQATLERLIRDREGDPAALGAQYLAATTAPEYESAWFKMMTDPERAPIRLTPAEREAVGFATDAMRAISVTQSGYAVPAALDPTVQLTSDGAINPVRQLAKVVTIASNTWNGINSAGITASYSAQATETSDNTPTLAQPSITVEKAQAFVPVNIEAFEDWSSLVEEMGREFRDAKDVLEATKFLSGAGHGSNEPEGLLTGGTAIVQTAGSAIFAPADVYSLLQAVPPRFDARASVLASQTVINTAYNFTPPGGTAYRQIVSDDRRSVLGKPLYPYSTMTTSTGTAQKVMIAGDIRAAYTIVDRIGASVEVIPHLFGTANNFPTGQRGLYMYWRNSAEVTNPLAIRVLQIKAT